MKPIEIKIRGLIQRSSQEMCLELLDTQRWSEFTGYSVLPGIKRAQFELRTLDIVGSRIKVNNTDGSSHVEEIVEWDMQHTVALRFQEFSAPLKYLASHFIETWTFDQTNGGTEVTRAMTMYPKGVLGWLALLPISRLMKKAFELNAKQLNVK